MRVLAFETSCDETAVAIYESDSRTCSAGEISTGRILAHSIYSQIPLHAQYGGVVPELASRDHIRKTLPLLQQTLVEAGITPATAREKLHGIAYTQGPGLIGALLVGAAVAKSVAFAWQLPAIGVHHLEGHLLAPMLEDKRPQFPFLALLVSGGHTQLIAVKAFGHYELLGESVDDAVGEAFDKTAKLLGLPYPGGAQLERLALKGDSSRFYFPRPMINRPGLDFSFSGIKTFAVNTVASVGELTEQDKADIACGFQEAIAETLAIKVRRALAETGYKQVVMAGGVAANQKIRQVLLSTMAKQNIEWFFPSLQYCTDNAAMIAYAGCQHLLQGKQDTSSGIFARPRWGLETAF